ncbi:hypothetical protein FNF29_06763 [Cafeteria roenbergensis]|uniref:Histone H2A/H2B/H3 domain-containing protein n=1 Tax=Cafeteria roenbergensis TaxID=33653 RepID=A0A5A8C5R7_CAFRO|nr:hypothetical protein FNF29_06763 [Cafeteria roenbergensis]KAA0161521.1 hypothetical protein FNF31_03804 [Cafeteria roenbergensis]KAA0169282.1 hypothetical protein FNF28_02236 [Cafeteria roenbergensis]|eukprot:KAA0148376.1 hypothetical protein FNF29_06763 [Cafeteria roenbergensis]
MAALPAASKAAAAAASGGTNAGPWEPTDACSVTLSCLEPGLRSLGLKVHPDLEVGTDGIELVRQYVEGLMACVLESLASDKGADALAATQGAMASAMSGELAKQACSEGARAVSKLVSAPAGGPLGERAGLVVNVESFIAAISALVPERLLTEASGLALAAAVEHVAAELVELGGNKARDGGRAAVSREDLLAAINANEDLRRTGHHFNWAAAARSSATASSLARAAHVATEPPTVPTRSISGGDIDLARRLNGLTQDQLAKIADFM